MSFLTDRLIKQLEMESSYKPWNASIPAYRYERQRPPLIAAPLPIRDIEEVQSSYASQPALPSTAPTCDMRVSLFDRWAGSLSTGILVVVILAILLVLGFCIYHAGRMSGAIYMLLATTTIANSK